MAGDEFDPFKLIKKILGKPDEVKPVPPPARPSPELAPVVVAPPEPPKKPREILLDALEKMTDGQRILRMLDLGRLASSSAAEALEARHLMDELRCGDFYERRLALYALRGAGDHALIFQGRNDRSALLRKLISAMAVEVCTDEELTQIARELQGSSRRQFFVRLRKKKRIALIDHCLQELEPQCENFERLIPFGSEPFVSERLLKSAEMMDAGDFGLLAHNHAAITAQYFLDWANQLQSADVRFVWLFNSVEPVLAEFETDKTLQTLRSAARVIPLDSLKIDGLLTRRPAQIVELMIEHHSLAMLEYETARVLPRLDADLLLRVLDLHSFEDNRWEWFEKLSVENKYRVFEQTRLSWLDDEGVISCGDLGNLPGELRIAETRRILKLPCKAGSASKLDYATYLPWDEALKVVEPHLKDSDIDTRTRAVSKLVAAVRFDRAHLGALLTLLEQRKHEADPVRSSFLSQLRLLPPSAWDASHLPVLDRIIRDALNAADGSRMSFSSIIELAVALIPNFTEWSCRTIATVWKERGRTTLGGYWNVSSLSHLSKEEAVALETAVSEAIRIWGAEEHEQQILALGRLFSTRLDSCQEIVRSLEAIVKGSSSNDRAEEALRLLHSWRRDRFETLVPILLELDKSWGQHDVIAEYLHRRRQDLLTPFLGQHAYQGRFSTGKVRVVPRYENGFTRWTTKQQAAFARELELLCVRENVDVSDGFYGALRLCRLPDPPMDKLAWLARKDSSQPAVRDYMIGQLSHVDNGDGVRLLLDCLQDDRLRKAIYSLRRALLQLSRVEAVAILKRVPVKSVSIYKEVVRLAGDVGGEEAFDWLISLSRTEMHKDVKAAVIRGLWNFCEIPEVWDVFDEAALSTERAVACAVIRIPFIRLSLDSRKRLARVLSLVLQHDDESTRLEALRRLTSSPVVDAERVMLKPLMSKLSADSHLERLMAGYIFFIHYAPDDEQSTEHLIMSVLKNRQNLLICLAQLERAQRVQPARMSLVTRAVLRTLWCDPLTTGHQVRIAFGGLPATDFARFLRSVEHANRLHYGAVQEAVNMCASSANRFTPVEMDQIERVMFNKKSDGLRRIGLALLHALGASASGWTPERLARLNSYRKDTSLFVASVAEFTLPGTETK